MTTQTQQTPAPAPAPAGQGTHHYVLTLDIPGRVSGSWYGTFTPAPTATRHDVFVHLLNQFRTDNPEFNRANVTFFSLEPNKL